MGRGYAEGEIEVVWDEDRWKLVEDALLFYWKYADGRGARATANRIAALIDDVREVLGIDTGSEQYWNG